jgi:zinc protease
MPRVKIILLRLSRLLAAGFILLLPSLHAAAQTGAPAPPQPQTEQLLNGLKILFVERPGDPLSTIRLRVHSGAAFDLMGKEGTIALLGDLLFPDPSTREYVTGDLQGRLDVSTAYDSIDITLTGRSEEIDRMVELLRNAIVNTQLSPEVINRVRESRLKTLRELSVSPVTRADRAIAARLYGTYPYGRLTGGTPESLARVERGDIIQARERFLNSNNATLVVIGGFDRRRAMRAFKQYLGAWRKGDQLIPQTFRQPEAVDPRPLVVDLPGVPDAEIRLAARGLARADRDAPAALVLAEIARERWLAAAPELKGTAATVRHDAYSLGGTFLMSASLPATSSAAQSLDAARKVLDALTKTPPTATELENAKRSVAATLNKEAERPERMADAWLDETTYGTRSATHTEMARATSLLTPADIQRVAAKLFQSATATVAVGDAGRLREDLSRLGEIEMFGASSAKEPAKPAAPTPLKAATPKRP